MKDKDIEIFDILKTFEDNLKNGSKNVKKNLSIRSEFKEMIHDSIKIEEEEKAREEYIRDMEESYQLYAKKTRGRRRKRFERAVLNSIAGAITNNTPGNITVNGANFHPDIGQLFVLFEGGGTSTLSSTTSNALGTQASVSIPAATYGLTAGVSVAISVLPGNLSELQSIESVSTTVLAGCPGGG